MSEGSGWKMFAWVPDGIYDHQSLLIRYMLVDGMPKYVMVKSWVDIGGPNEIPEELKRPWGSFPDMPPKPDKK